MDNLSTTVVIPLPKRVIESLDKKTKTALGEAIQRYSEQRYVRYPEHYSSGGCVQHCTGMLFHFDEEDFDVINDVAKSIVRRKIAEGRAKDLQDDSDELKKVKDSMSHLKKFIG